MLGVSECHIFQSELTLDLILLNSALCINLLALTAEHSINLPIRNNALAKSLQTRQPLPDGEPANEQRKEDNEHLIALIRLASIPIDSLVNNQFSPIPEAERISHEHEHHGEPHGQAGQVAILLGVIGGSVDQSAEEGGLVLLAAEGLHCLYAGDGLFCLPARRRVAGCVLGADVLDHPGEEVGRYCH